MLLVKRFSKNPVLYLTKEYGIDIMLLNFKKIYFSWRGEMRKSEQKRNKRN